jgi:hypothetical protein
VGPRRREGAYHARRRQGGRHDHADSVRARTGQQSVEYYIGYALDHSYAYEVLFDGVGKPPSLHEPWPSFNLMRERIAKRIGGPPRQYSRLMLAVWSLMHGAVMLIIRGRFEGPLRVQTVHACIDACESIIEAARSKRTTQSGPKWPAGLVLGEGEESRVGDGERAKKTRGARQK